MKQLDVNTSGRMEFLDISEKIKSVVEKSFVKNGVLLLYVPHTTAGLTINENADPCVKKDILTKLTRLVPENDGYTHTEGNSDSHILATLTGSQLFVFIENGKPAIGTWQGIYFCEYDGPRKRKLLYEIIKIN